MRFEVRIDPLARREYNRLLAYIAERSKAGAIAWGAAFDRAMARLEAFADTMALAEEDDLVDFEVREIHFKTRRGLVYRVLFTINERVVQILHVRGPGQDYLTSDELAHPH